MADRGLDDHPACDVLQRSGIGSFLFFFKMKSVRAGIRVSVSLRTWEQEVSGSAVDQNVQSALPAKLHRRIDRPLRISRESHVPRNSHRLTRELVTGLVEGLTQGFSALPVNCWTGQGTVMACQNFAFIRVYVSLNVQ